MQNVGNPSLITRQPNTFLSLCSQLPKPSSIFAPLQSPQKTASPNPIPLSKKKRNYGLTLDFIMLFKGHYLIASQPLRCPLSARFLHPFIFSPQLFFKQKELNLTHQGSNPWPSQCQIKAKPPSQLMFHANSHTFTIMLSPNTAMYNFKNKNKSTNTPIAHIGLKPKSSHTIKVLSTIWASTITHHTH